MTTDLYAPTVEIPIAIAPLLCRLFRVLMVHPDVRTKPAQKRKQKHVARQLLSKFTHWLSIYVVYSACLAFGA